MVVGPIYCILTGLDSNGIWSDTLLVGYKVRYWYTFFINFYYLRLFLKFFVVFLALCYCFGWIIVYLTTSIQLKFYFIEYPEVWTMWTCFGSLLFKQPVGDIFILFFKFYGRFISKNKKLKFSNKFVWKLLGRLVINLLIAISWSYVEFIWYCILALSQDWQTPEQTFIKLYKERVEYKQSFQYYYYCSMRLGLPN